MKHFTLEELTRSAAAVREGVDNTPGPEAEANLVQLAERLLDPLRERWGGPITVTSGYRSPQVNSLVGGARNSQHVQGKAADITAGSRERNRELFRCARSLGGFDQLIDEYGFKWIHISYDGPKNRGQILHKTDKGYDSE